MPKLVEDVPIKFVGIESVEMLRADEVIVVTDPGDLVPEKDGGVFVTGSGKCIGLAMRVGPDLVGVELSPARARALADGLVKTADVLDAAVQRAIRSNKAPATGQPGPSPDRLLDS